MTWKGLEGERHFKNPERDRRRTEKKGMQKER